MYRYILMLHPNIAIEWLTVMLYIQEVPGLVIGLEANCFWPLHFTIGIGP